MIEQKLEDVLFETEGALINDSFPGFKQDYLCLHSLLRKHKPQTVLEIGTCTGGGVNVIATALPNAKVYSLDLDYESMMKDPKDFPIGENGIDRVGSESRFPYTQLRGDSMTFDYSKYPCVGYFVDGAHDEKHVQHETREILKLNPKLIAYHDSDILEVMSGIVFGLLVSANADKYELYKVEGTRITYLLKK